MLVLFVLGYLAIVFEHPLRLDKSASALLTGVLCWTAYALRDRAGVGAQLQHHFGDIAGILFFLLGAMAVVELIDAHDGFDLITARITTRRRRRLLVVIAVVAFFLSAVLDNLTTAIVMTSLVRKLVRDERDQMYFGGVVVIAANAGGAWSPIGDVTTTMLWMGGEVSAVSLVARLFVPSVVSVVVPVALIAIGMKGEIPRPALAGGEAVPAALHEALAALPPGGGRLQVTLTPGAAAVGRSLVALDVRARTGASVLALTRGAEVMAPPSALLPLGAGDALEISGAAAEIAASVTLLFADDAPRTTAAERATVLGAGVAALLFVPVFKALTGLPPVMGVLLALGGLGTLTELLHKRKNDERKSALSVAGALQRVDSPSVLFFLGILLAISALESAGLLRRLAVWLGAVIGNLDVVTMAIGFASAVIDNVPLVAAARGMYPHSTFPTDHRFWVFLAYCAGTGGSILVIGSAAGIAVMGVQRITFGWYLRHLTLPALLGYLAGALTYVVSEWLRS